MTRLAVVILCCLIAACGLRAEVVADTVLPGEPYTFNYHLRVLPEGRNAGASLRWNVQNDSNYRFARWSVSGYDTDDWNYNLALAIGKVSGGVTTEKVHNLRLAADPYEHGCSLRLTYGPGGAVLTAGVRSVAGTYPVEYDPAQPPAFQALCSDKSAVITNRIETDIIPPAEFAPFADTQAIVDAGGCLWQYFDRKTHPLNTVWTDIRHIATYQMDDDTIAVARLDDDGIWEPMRIKAYMKATSIPGVYDLTWVQPSGRHLSYSCSARVDGDFLIFEFPYWGAIIRFARL